MEQTIAVLGGDLRQVHLARLLAADGWDVACWGLERENAPNPVSLEEGICRDILLLPLPVCRGGELNLPLSGSTLPLDRLWPRLRRDQLLLGGLTKELSPRLRAEFGLTLVDYYDREETQVSNAVPTAEGAIARAMDATEDTLMGARCLVLGYGRIGKVLCHRLAGLGAHVTATARKYGDLAWIRAFGYEAVPTDRIADRLESFDLIFNTIPAPVLDRRLLARTGENCVLMELASAPGGVDAAAAQALGRRLIQAPGLPGLVAPRSAAAAILNSVYHILEERGEPI